MYNMTNGIVKRCLLALSAITCLAPNLYAANSQESVTGTIDILAPISLTNEVSDCLDFGSIAKGTSVTYVTMPPTSGHTPTYAGGDATVLSSSNPRAAMFTVGGEVGKLYTITLPSSSKLYFGTNELNLTNFTCSKPTGGTAVIGVSDNSFYVGATLEMTTSAAAGQYTGTFSVTVDYN
jgi:Mat/Ecp fimbriae major subunit